MSLSSGGGGGPGVRGGPGRGRLGKRFRDELLSETSLESVVAASFEKNRERLGDV